MLTTTFQLPDLSVCWDQSQGFRQANDRWTAYYNQLAIAVVKPFLNEVAAPLKVRSALVGLAQASQWSCVTGTALRVGDQRWLVLPTEQIDEDEIEIPQEWVDIADWAVEQIVAVSVNPDDLSARILGFARGEMVRTEGIYRPMSRTYALDRAHWVSDFATLQVIEQLTDVMDSAAQRDQTLRAIEPLTISQAQNLIPRLAGAILPRLAVPFTTWAALIQNPGWRQHYHQLRQTGEAPRSVIQWLRSGLESFSLEAGWQSFNVAMAGTRSGGAVAIIRVLTIEGLRYELRIQPSSADFEAGEWRFELRSLESDRGIPAGLLLRLMTEDLQGFEGNEAIATEEVDCLWIEVSLELGEALIWEIEPTPTEGDRELICF